MEWRREVGLEGEEERFDASLGDLERERKLVPRERNGGMFKLYMLRGV